MSSTSPSDGMSPESSSTSALRVITPRRTPPNGRAIAGGVLVAIAVLATYATASHSSQSNLTSVVVAARDLAPGTRVSPSDIRVIRTRIAPELASHVVTSSSAINGSSILAPLRAGDPISNTSVSPSSSAIPYIETSFAIPASRAINGALQPGDVVDILATDKSSPSTTARAAATNVRILKLQTASSSSLGQNGDLTVTVGVNSLTDAATIAAAVDNGQITLVKTTGTHVQ